MVSVMKLWYLPITGLYLLLRAKMELHILTLFREGTYLTIVVNLS